MTYIVGALFVVSGSKSSVIVMIMMMIRSNHGQLDQDGTQSHSIIVLMDTQAITHAYSLYTHQILETILDAS